MSTVDVPVAQPRAVPAEAFAYGGLVLASLGWASAFIAGKLVLAEMTPLSTATWRYLIATVVLLPFAFRSPRPLEFRRIVVPLAIMVVCGGVLYQWLFLFALKHTSATNTALLIALNPMFTILLAPAIGERVSRARLAGVGLALAGAVAVITKGDWHALTDVSLHAGDLVAVAAAGAWAAFNLASRRTVHQLSPAVTNCTVYGLGAAALGVLASHEHPWAQLTAASPTAIGSLLMMVALSSVLAGQLFLMGVRALGVSRAVVFIYLVPVLTAALSALLLGEQLTLMQLLGGTAVLAGVYWTSRQR